MNSPDTLGSIRYGEAFRRAGGLGALAWITYAAVEALFLGILVPLAGGRGTATPADPLFTGLLFGLYPAVGFLAAGTSGVVLRSLVTLLPRLARLSAGAAFGFVATTTVVIAFTANLVESVGPGVTAALAIALALSLLGLPLARSVRPDWALLRGLATPVVAMSLLVGLTWLAQDYLLGVARSRKAIIALMFVALVFAAGAAGAWLDRRFNASSWRRFRRVSGGVAAGLILAAGFVVQQQPIDAGRTDQRTAAGRTPNVILISLDTVRADHLSIYGGRASTPHLEAFLQTATLYRNAISTADFTLASHASLFTGLYATRHGAHSLASGDIQALNGRFDTLAEELAERGYATAAVVANYGYFHPAMGLAQGFEYFDARPAVTFWAEAPAGYLRHVARRVLAFVWEQHAGPPFYDANAVNSRAAALLTRFSASNRPFFLFINYMDAHWPYMPPPPFDSLYAGKSASFTTRDYQNLWTGVAATRTNVSRDQRAHLESQYDGAITYLDSALGTLFARLRALGLYENSLIVVTSDHGEAFGDKDFLGHGNSVYQDQVRVPLLVKFPGSQRREQVDSPVSGADVFPTILEIAGQDIPGDIDGVAFTPTASRRTTPVMAETHSNKALNGLHPRFRRIQRAIIAGHMKLVVSSAGQRELYDLSHDPDEQRDRLEASADVATALSTALDLWLRTIGASDGRAPRLDPATIERLRSLGYIH